MVSGKMKKANLDQSELEHFKTLGQDLLRLSVEKIEKSIELNVLFDLEDEP